MVASALEALGESWVTSTYPAPDDGRIGHGQGIGGLSHHDLGVGVHAGPQAVGLVNADGHRVGGGAAVGSAFMETRVTVPT